MGENAGLNVQWVFGFSKEIVGGVQTLTKSGRNALFSISAHTGIIYDYEYRTQTILQGHCDFISCCAVSKDKRWIVTADSSTDSILVVWDSLSGAPVKTLFTPHAHGVLSVDISDDALFVCTLSVPHEGRQEIAIWAWTKDSDSPVIREQLLTRDKHHEIRFNPTKQSEISTTGQKNVCFWDWEGLKLEGYMAKVSKTDFGHYSGKFTSTIFFADSGNALTATDDGYVIVWGNQFSTVLLDDPNDRNIKMASKVIRLVDCSINTMITINDYLAIGCADGAVRFFDFSLRLEAWFEDLAAGPIISLSFANQKCPFPEGEGGGPGMHFWVPDFMVGTSDSFVVGVESSCYDEVSPDDRRGTLLVQGMADHISDISCHPTKTLVALCCYDGSLQIWDYEMKLLMNLREFNTRTNAKALTTTGTKHRSTEKIRLRPQCIAFDPFGEFVAVGFTSGDIKLLSAATFEDVSSYSPSSDTIVHLKFSPSGQYFAAYDSTNHVIIMKKIDPGNSRGGDDEEEGSHASFKGGAYIYLGRAITHTAAITGIEFGIREHGEVLISVGEDRNVVEYDLVESNLKNGIKIVQPGAVRVELTARPTAIMWHPHIEEDIEDRFVIANDEFKFKEFNADSKQCRKTTLAPTFGGPPNKLLVIQYNGAVRNYLYSTAERIVGIGCLPLSGDPTEVMGLVAHPARISSICASHDGRFLFTAGGSDLTVAMFAVDYTALAPKGDRYSLANFLDLLEGGSGGELHNDIIDYFYLCQLRNQGENIMEDRAITGRIPVEEIASLVRAIGFYPTEEEIENMMNEVRYRHFMSTGIAQDDISLEETIKLYVNHRPVSSLNSNEIETVFDIISQKLNSTSTNKSNIRWSDLKNLLMSEGEAMAPRDLEDCLSILMGENKFDSDSEHVLELNASSFATRVLGFEDFSST